MVYYDIQRYIECYGWVHCTWGGKTKKAALKRLKKIANYSHHRGETFRILRTTQGEDFIFKGGVGS